MWKKHPQDSKADIPLIQLHETVYWRTGRNCPLRFNQVTTATNNPGKNLAVVVSNHLEQPNPLSNTSHHNTYSKAGRRGTVWTEAGKGPGRLMLPPHPPQRKSRARAMGRAVNLVLASYFKYEDTDTSKMSFPRLQSSSLAELVYSLHLLTLPRWPLQSDIHSSIPFYYSCAFI